jgi:DNA-directed RNA polymerase subunit RPC12/RpoP
MSTAERVQIGECEECGTRIWSDHPYGWCSECGKKLPASVARLLPGTQAPKREEGSALEVGGRQISCPICGHDRYRTRKTLMGTRGAAFFNADWANPSAENFICLRCGYVLWFMQ